MKFFCRECGKKNEFIGMANKPSSCQHCNSTLSAEKEGAASTKTLQVGDMNFDKKFLLNLISFEYEPD